MHVRALFSPELLQAGAMKGLITDLAFLHTERNEPVVTGTPAAQEQT